MFRSKISGRIVLLTFFALSILTLKAHSQPVDSENYQLISGKLRFEENQTIEGKTTIPLNKRYKALADVIIKFPIKSVIDLSKDTEFEIFETGFFVYKGNTRFQLHPKKKNFQVKTPCATLGVRGTVFKLNVLPEKTIVNLENGSLAIENKLGCIILKAGESAIAENGKPPVIQASSVKKTSAPPPPNITPMPATDPTNLDSNSKPNPAKK
ncbi:MAG: FecR domain-containing protein [Candidatus Riflebacteria bacterium]|nr:FecR domain-containing protein [Candidatus Riflebacteria bacterium]